LSRLKSSKAGFCLFFLYALGHAKMTKEQIAKAQDLSREMVEANPKLMGD
jgi:hypothetical protein